MMRARFYKQKLAAGVRESRSQPARTAHQNGLLGTKFVPKYKRARPGHRTRPHRENLKTTSKMVCLAGEAGIATTTLINEFARQLVVGRHTHLLLRGACSERLLGPTGCFRFLTRWLDYYKANSGQLQVA